MAEVNGSLVFKFPEHVQSELQGESSKLTQEEVSLILTTAGLDPAKGALPRLLSASFLHEGLEKREGYVLIYPFDEPYMDLMKALVYDGEGIEIYGGISHEYGPMEYYVLTAEGKRFVGYIDEEGEAPMEPAEVRAEFGRLVPDQVKKTFSEIF